VLLQVGFANGFFLCHSLVVWDKHHKGLEPHVADQADQLVSWSAGRSGRGWSAGRHYVPVLPSRWSYLVTNVRDLCYPVTNGACVVCVACMVSTMVAEVASRCSRSSGRTALRRTHTT